MFWPTGKCTPNVDKIPQTGDVVVVRGSDFEGNVAIPGMVYKDTMNYSIGRVVQFEPISIETFMNKANEFDALACKAKIPLYYMMYEIIAKKEPESVSSIVVRLHDPLQLRTWIEGFPHLSIIRNYYQVRVCATEIFADRYLFRATIENKQMKLDPLFLYANFSMPFGNSIETALDISSYKPLWLRSHAIGNMLKLVSISFFAMDTCVTQPLEEIVKSIQKKYTTYYGNSVEMFTEKASIKRSIDDQAANATSAVTGNMSLTKQARMNKLLVNIKDELERT